MAKKQSKPPVELVEEQSAEQPEVAEEAAEASGESYSVHSKRTEGFYRLGQKFTHEPTVFGPGELSDAQLAVLKAEPMLVVKAVL